MSGKSDFAKAVADKYKTRKMTDMDINWTVDIERLTVNGKDDLGKILNILSRSEEGKHYYICGEAIRIVTAEAALKRWTVYR